MTDTASLIARVKTEGADEAARSLDAFQAAAESAETAADALAPAVDNVGESAQKTVKPVKEFGAIIDAATGKAINFGRTQEKGAAAADTFASGLKQGGAAANEEGREVDNLRQKIEGLGQTQQKTTQTTDTATKSGGQFRNTIGQVGFQVQDLVVQLQSGTSAFVAFGQQGSQMAGAFGPGGAVLGAVIALASAVGGVLYKALSDTTATTKDLENGASELAKSFQQTKDGTLEFSDALVQLSQNGDIAYGNMVKLLALQTSQQIDAATTAIKAQGKELLGNSVSAQTNITTLDELIARNADVGQVLSDVNVMADANSAKYGNLSNAVGELADNYGVGKREIADMLVAQREFNAEPTAENAQKVADATTRAAAAATKNKKEILDQAEAAQKNAIALDTAKRQQDLVTESQKRMGDATNSTTKRINEQNDAIVRNAQIAALSERDRIAAQAKADKEAFAKREQVTQEQIDAYNKATDAQATREIAELDKREKEKNERIAKAADRRAEAQQKREENEAKRQQTAADNFLATIDRTSGDEIARITETEKQKLAKLAEFQKQGLIVGQEYENAKTNIMLTAEDARQKELEKRQQQQAQKQGQHDQFIASVQAANATELELIDTQQKAKEDKAKEFRDRGIINEKEYQDALAAYAQEADDKRLDSYSNMLGDTTSNLKAALGEGNALYKAAAITQTVIDTYKAATGAYSALSSIPIVGPALGVAAAAAAVAAGMANVAKIRSAREQGGQLAPGQVSTIAERGKAEVIMPAGASRVRTAEQMRQIMGDNGGGRGNDSVVIVNQTTGRIDQAQTERDDEGRLHVIIREIVAGDLQDSNSDISQARRVTRDQPGH